MGKAAWRIECACDAEILKRTQARRGRGNVDTEGVGVMATVASIAADAGVSPRTIFQNAQVHNTFFEGQTENSASACTILEDKIFYVKALAAPDPHSALDAMAAKKAADPFYTSRDAERDVTAMNVGRRAESLPLPSDTYSVLLADPPWQYDFSVSESREIENQYPTMTARGGDKKPFDMSRVTVTGGSVYINLYGLAGGPGDGPSVIVLDVTTAP